MIDFYGTMRENAARVPSTRQLTAPLREVWNTETLSGSFHDQEDVPLLASAGRLFYVDSKANAVSFDVETQERVWTYPLGARLGAVHGRHLFLWAHSDELHVVDTMSGQLRAATFSFPAERIAVVGDLVLGHGKDHDRGGSRMWALDWKTGRRLWADYLPEKFTVAGCFCANEDVVIYSVASGSVRSKESKVVARCPATGEELWRTELAPLWGVASLIGERVVGCFDGQITALGTADGSVLWQTPGLPGYVYGDRFYCVDTNARYRVLDIKTGRVLHSFPLKSTSRLSIHGVGHSQVKLVAETHIFVRTPNDALLAFTRDKGEFVWGHKPTAPSMKTEVVSVGGRLYYLNGYQRLFCLEPNNA